MQAYSLVQFFGGHLGILNNYFSDFLDLFGFVEIKNKNLRDVHGSCVLLKRQFLNEI